MKPLNRFFSIERFSHSIFFRFKLQIVKRCCFSTLENWRNSMCRGGLGGALKLKLRVFPYQRKKVIGQSLENIDV